jgi:hypothetical protein
MARMTKAQARRRLLEAEAKFKKVYMAGGGSTSLGNWAGIVRTADMEAVSKIVAKCIKRIQ